VKWTSAVVDATPQYCQRCERRVTGISLTRWISGTSYFIRCGFCDFILAKVTLEQPIGEDS